MNNALKLKSISVSEMDNNCYLICAGEEALLVDAADDAPALLNLAKENGVRISAVLTTHRHWDHVRATKEVIKATGATHYASFLDSPAMPAPVDVELKQGDTLTFAGHEFPAIILRGHTPGGVAIAVDIDGTTNLFVGDSLFPGGVGRTDSEGDFVRLYKDVNERIFDVYPDSAIVRPGHGKSTTLGLSLIHI